MPSSFVLSFGLTEPPAAFALESVTERTSLMVMDCSTVVGVLTSLAMAFFLVPRRGDSDEYSFKSPTVDLLLDPPGLSFTAVRKRGCVLPRRGVSV